MSLRQTETVVLSWCDISSVFYFSLCIRSLPAHSPLPRGATGHVAQFPLAPFYFLLSFLVLLIAHFFHPLYNLPLQRFLNGDVRHRGRRRSTVPMLLVRRKPNDITRPDFFDRPSPPLRPSKAGRDDQRLTEWMPMPGGTGTRLE